MTGVKKLAQPEFREKVTSSILELLSHLPEMHKNVFIWKHYRGWRVEEIAAALKCSRAEVENILRQINSLLFQRTGALLTKAVQLDEPSAGESNPAVQNFLQTPTTGTSQRGLSMTKSQIDTSLQSHCLVSSQ